MKRLTYILLLISFTLFSVSYQNHNDASTPTYDSFKKGEFLKWRIHYGLINAGYATLEMDESHKNGQTLYHAKGKGWTVGAARWFAKIDDIYESHFTKSDLKPVFFKRRVNEDGFRISRDLHFDHNAKKVTINDLEKKTKQEEKIGNVQDMVSAFYFLREIDLSNIKEGDEKRVDLFFDGETVPFKLKFIKRETIKTSLGEFKTWKMKPMVQKGRIFEGQDSVTLWISDDANKVPIRIQAKLVVGSIKVDLDDYSGLVTELKVE